MSEVKRYLIQKTPIGTMMKPNPEGNWIDGEDFDRVTAERDALQALLTAADELNDVMAGLLRDARQYHGVTLLTDPPQDAWKSHRISERIEAALKPAEPAKDEHVCTGCGSKGWTANCAVCVPY